MAGQMIRRRWWVMAAAVALVLGCSSDPDDDPIVFNQGEDAGPDVGVDAGPTDDDVGTDDVGGDAGEDADAEEKEDVEPEGPVDGEGDNCPEISNPDQTDRSRDGVGDACAHFPFYHDPSNPEHVQILRQWDGMPADNFSDARDHWTLELPFMVEGVIGEPIEDPEVGSVDPNIDHYAIETDGPTTLLIHIEPDPALWPVLVVASDALAEMPEHETVVVAPNRGEEEVRDVHLPVAGRYYIAVSDFENLTGGSPTGGADYGYRLSVSSPPLPEAQSIALPAPRQVASYERREAAVFSVDVAGEDAIKVAASGAPRNQNSFVLPAIDILDADTGQTLAFTTNRQANQDSLRNELTAKLGDRVERVEVVVEGHTSLGDNDLVVDIDVFDKPEHLASFDDPRQEREDHLLWVEPDTEIASEIGPPRPVGDTTLEADEDYFLHMAEPGQLIRVVADPDEDSLLAPEIALGEMHPSWFNSWHQVRGGLEPGQAAAFTKLMTTDRWRDAAIRVVHRGNAASSLPVGGPKYGYRFAIETLDIDEATQRIDALPATVPVELDPGQQGLYDFPLEAGHRYHVDYDGPFGAQLDLIDTETWEIVETTREPISFVHRPDQDLIFGVRDRFGHGVDVEDGLEIAITEGVGPVAVDAPRVVEDRFDGQTEQKIFEVSADPEEIITARTSAPAAGGQPPSVRITAPAAHTTQSDSGTMAAARAVEETSLHISVTHSGTGALDYELDVHTAKLEERQAPFEHIGTLGSEIAEKWWLLSVDEHTAYAVNATGSPPFGGSLDVGAYDPETLQPVGELDDGFGVFDSGERDQIVVAVGDPSGLKENIVDYGLSVAPVEPIEIGEDGAVDDVELVDGLRPAFVEFHHEGAGMSTLELSVPEGREAVARLANDAYEVFQNQTSQQPATAVARPGVRHWSGAAIPRGHDGETWTVDIDVGDVSADDAHVLSNTEATLTQPHNVEQWPAAFRGSLSALADPRVFSAQMDAGSTVWILAMPAPAKAARMTDMELWLRDPSGFDYASDGRSGTGLFSTLEAVEIHETGLWYIDVERPFFGFGNGEFVLFMWQP